MTPNRRATDNSTLAHWTALAKEYAIFWIPIIWVISQLGFSVLTPRLTVQQVKTAFDSSQQTQEREIDVLKVNMNGLYTVHSSMAEELNALRKFDCLSKEISTREKFLAGLRCDEVDARDKPQQP